ncbi:hypothetical protein MF672_010985 [Actinomadura sp. ATCC 31491]|uniref:Uncharacterized protein n=1 Tax=Actinomadura luzonensis TaxID=2805427 RepID=A0ABT0FPS1_9ACTN|nr:hypothetical protein [Actinomadura luzonensis]MCK2214312.1 hypothetical protein [Actinomadura luzonensis]
MAPPDQEAAGAYGVLVRPALLNYAVSQDQGGGFHARWIEPLPPALLAKECQQEVTAPTWLELTQAAVRNRVRIWLLQSAGGS